LSASNELVWVSTSVTRSTYTITLGDIVYVLDAFQKKSKSGIATRHIDLDRIERRLKQAKGHYEERQRKARDS
jgi:phage-related protein